MQFKLSRTFVCLTVLILLLISSSLSFAEIDITDQFHINTSRMRFDRRTSESYLDISVTNISQEIYLTPIKVIIETISSPSVKVANPDGYTDDGLPYIIIYYGTNNSNNELTPAETSEIKKLVFDNPNRSRFSFTTSVLGSEYPASILEQPTDSTSFDYDLGGEVPIQISSRKYVGMVELPPGFPKSYQQLFIETGIAGLTALSDNNLFKVQMNSNVTSLMMLVDESGEGYMMKIFPKSDEIRDKNPVISARSTALALISLQSGVLTSSSNLDAITLKLFSNLPEITNLENQIYKELNNGTFKLNTSLLSIEVIELCYEVHKALYQSDATDLLGLNINQKIQFTLANLSDHIIPNAHAEWVGFDCQDSLTSYLFDDDGSDHDGVCIHSDPAYSGVSTDFTLKNKVGRWAALGFYDDSNNFKHIDWVEPRHFHLPNIADILFEATSITGGELADWFDKITGELFDIGDDKTFMDRLTDSLSTWWGNGLTESSFKINEDGLYKLLTQVSDLLSQAIFRMATI